MTGKAAFLDIKNPFYGFENSKQKLPKAIFAVIFNTQHSTLNTQHSTLNTQHSTLNYTHYINNSVNLTSVYFLILYEKKQKTAFHK